MLQAESVVAVGMESADPVAAIPGRAVQEETIPEAARLEAARLHLGMMWVAAVAELGSLGAEVAKAVWLGPLTRGQRRKRTARSQEKSPRAQRLAPSPAEWHEASGRCGFLVGDAASSVRV